MNLYFDLETIGTTNADVIAELAENIKPPGTHKKAETIAAWMAEHRDAALKEAVGKTSFDGTYGQIVCIGWAVENDAARTVSQTQDTSEAGMLELFASDMRMLVDSALVRPVFIGHNVAGFDLRFLYQRFVINNIEPPAGIPFNAKGWDDSVFDTMVRWNPERERRISLDKLCRALGVPTPKDGFDGSMVWDAFRAGEFEKIATYCAKDVDAVRACHRRMTFAAQENAT